MKPLVPMAKRCAGCYRYEKNAGQSFHDASADQCPGFLYSDCPVYIRPPLPVCWRSGCETECWKDAWYGRDWFTTGGGYYSLGDDEWNKLTPEQKMEACLKNEGAAPTLDNLVAEGKVQQGQ